MQNCPLTAVIWIHLVQDRLCFVYTTKQEKDTILAGFIYVDDMLITGHNLQQIQYVKQLLS